MKLNVTLTLSEPTVFKLTVATVFFVGVSLEVRIRVMHILTRSVSKIPPVVFPALVPIFSMFGHVLFPVRVLGAIPTLIIKRVTKCEIGTIFCKMSVFVALETRKKIRLLCITTTPLVHFNDLTVSGGR